VPLRTTVLRSLLTVTAIAVITLAVPLAWYMWTSNETAVVAELEQEATRVVALTPEGASELPAPLNPDVVLGLYASDGLKISGEGPRRDNDAAGALETGSTRVKHEDGYLAVYVPFAPEGKAQVTVRAAMPESVPQSRTYRAWSLLLLAVLVAFAVSALVALRRSRQLALPFERIADAARELRDGSLAVRVGPTGIAEGDEVGHVLEDAAVAAAERIHQERELSQDANHQVRTPVAAARLTLEAALSMEGSDLELAATEAVAQLDRASNAIDEVLALRREGAVVRAEPAADALDDAISRWTPVARHQGRDLVVHLDPAAGALPVAGAVLRQVLDVLFDNALRHGQGIVTLAVREAADSVVVDVSDEGSLPAALLGSDPFARGTTTREPGAPGGFGLPLARSLAERVGGRLVLATSTPTRFTLLLNAELPHE
jgi:signal transduction histidine kinase